MQEISKGKDLGGKVREAEGAGEWLIVGDIFNPAVEFLANG